MLLSVLSNLYMSTAIPALLKDETKQPLPMQFCSRLKESTSVARTAEVGVERSEDRTSIVLVIVEQCSTALNAYV